jgi:ribosomal protein L40E
MIKCPRCNATLPAWAQSCQFCQADVSGVARPVAAKKDESRYYQAPKWVWIAYYVIAAFWILNGVRDILWGLDVFGRQGEGGFFESGISVGMLAVGFVTALVGLGLILKIELARGIVNVIAGLRILFGALSLFMTIPLIFIVGIFGFLAAIWTLIDIVLAVLIIYIIGETDSGTRDL